MHHRLSRPLLFIILGVLFTAPVFWGANLVLVLRLLNKHPGPIRNPGSFGSTTNMQEFPWSPSEVALEFRNDLFHITSEAEWASLIPKALQPQNSEDYFISMHQQLHCLNLVRIAYIQLHASISNTTLRNYEEVDMCVEQLRQNILCNGDITLEPTKLRKGPEGYLVPSTRGEKVVHRCRDWQKLEMLLEHVGRDDQVKM